MTDEWNDGKKCGDVCRFAPPQNKWPCIGCDMRWHDRAESIVFPTMTDEYSLKPIQTLGGYQNEICGLG